MKFFYKTLLFAVLLPALSYAQSNYKPGYVINLKGDTLKGFIDYREWGSNPDAIDFKTAITDRNSKRFTPTDINYFNITGLESYLRYSGPISMDATDKDHLSTSRDTSFRVAVVFFRVLQKGNKLALYSYTDNLKSRFYVSEAPDYKPVELVFRLYKVYGTVNETENTYMKQLFALGNKYEVSDNGFQWDIEHAGYNSDDILKIVSKINHISKAEYQKANAIKGPFFNLFVSAGVNIDKISTATGSTFYNAGGRSQTSYGAAGSFGINIFANPSTRQLQFRAEVGVAQSKYNWLYESKFSPYIPFRASFDEITISIVPQIIYNFYNAENFKIYGDVGMALNYYKFSNAYLGSQSQPNSASDIEANDPYYFNTSDNGFLLKIGAQIHKNWGIYAQYMSGVAVTRGGYFQMSSRCEQVGLNYYFW